MRLRMIFFSVMILLCYQTIKSADGNPIKTVHSESSRASLYPARVAPVQDQRMLARPSDKHMSVVLMVAMGGLMMLNYLLGDSSGGQISNYWLNSTHS